MSLDRSLKTGGGLSSKRSVMTRGERIAKMTEDKKFDPKDPKKSKPLGLPKTLVPKG
jgi:small basic protein (TIGR04137 family)